MQQVIHPAMACPLEQVEAHEAGLQAAIASAARAPFDLAHGPLMRARLVRLGAQDHVLVLTLHHIVTDGASLPILIEEFTRHYAAFASGQAPQVEALPIQYADFALWQRLWLEAGEGERQLQYWREQLGDEHPLLSLPLDRKRPSVPSQQGDCVSVRCPPQPWKACASWPASRAVRCSWCCWRRCMRCCTATAASTTSVSACRWPTAHARTCRRCWAFHQHPGAAQPAAARATLLDLLQALKAAAVQAQSHQDVPFEQLVDALQPERSLNQSPLFR